MNCTEAKQRIELYASGSVEGEEKRALEEHLSLCEGCRLELELRQAIQNTPSLAPRLDFGDGSTGGVEGSTPTAAPLAPPPEGPDSGESPAPPDDSAFATGSAMAPDDSAFATGSAMAPDDSAEISFADLSLDMPTLMTETAQPTAPPPPPPPSAEEAAAARAHVGQPPATSSSNWEFEPIDAPRESTPPEGSLSFAHQALERKREDELKGKNAMMRVILWGAGALAGLALLGVSIWVALAVRQEPEDPAPVVASAPGSTPAEGGSEAESTGTTQAGAGEDAGVAPVPSARAGGEADAAPSGPSPLSTSGPPVIPAPAARSSATATPSPIPGADAPEGDEPRAIYAGDLAAGSLAPLPVAPKNPPAPPPAAPKNPPAPPPAAPKNPPIARKRASAPAAGTATRAGAPVTTPKPAPPGPGAAPASGSADIVSSERHAASGPATTPPPGGKGNPVWPTEEAPAERPQSPTPVAVEAARETSRVAAPETSTTAVSAPTPPAGETAVPRPIDRLHLATQNASAAGDLVSLRKLKSTWKNFIRAGAGPDRARAKREYADCLWIIQELTSRQSDQREALAAYREFVLYAPAGGTDARTVSRMRYLEDVLSDSR